MRLLFLFLLCLFSCSVSGQFTPEKPRAIFEEGMQLYNEQDYEGAIKRFNIAKQMMAADVNLINESELMIIEALDALVKENQRKDSIIAEGLSIKAKDPIIDNFTIDRTNKDHAFFFAINTYEDEAFPDLKNPISNAQDIANELSSYYGFKTEVIENPTRKAIKNKLNDIQQKFEQGAYPKDGQLLLFFSGHGEYLDDSNGYFVTSDAEKDDIEATSIPYDLYRPKMAKIDCKHILVVIDACYSGSFYKRDLMKSGNKPSQFKRPGELSEMEAYYENYKQRQTRKYIVAGGLEKTPDQSELAYKFLEGLRTLRFNKGIFGVDYLFSSYVNKAKPTPLTGEFEQNEAGSNFLFFVKQN